MRRCVLTLLIVAALSAWIARIERAAGIPELRYAAPNHPEWVRTADGWQRRAVLTVEPRTPWFEIHPGLVAGFQLSFSLLVLVAFPAKAATVRPKAAPNPSLAVRGLARSPEKRRRRITAAAR